MIYAILNPIPWALFLLGVILCIYSVKAFHRKYPQYPFGTEADDKGAQHVAGVSHQAPAVEGLGR